MKASTLLRSAVLLCVVLLIIGAAIVLRSSDNASAKRHGADLEYLKSANSVAPLKDPELLFVLMTEDRECRGRRGDSHADWHVRNHSRQLSD
jgi:hypothetical protein